MRFLLIIFFSFIGLNLSAQLQTYYGLKFGMIAGKIYSSEFVQQVHTGFITDGFSIDFALRKELSNRLSFGLGYSFRIYGFAYELPGLTVVYSNIDYVYHKIPLYLDYAVDLHENKVSGYVLFGILLSFNQDNFVNGIHTISQRDSNLNATIDTKWKYIPDSRINSYYSTGLGSRIRLLNELHLDVGLAYAFRFRDLRDYSILVSFDDGEKQTYSFSDKGNYLNFNIGIMYSIQETRKYLKRI